MSSRPNILFLFSDEHSFRFMGHMDKKNGGENIQTPNFDKLAASGTVFSDSYCHMPLCTPSRISMLTGLEVRKSGAWSNNSVLRPELPTIPGVFRDAGYATCLVGKMHLYGTQQFAGFEHRPYGDLTGSCGHQWEPIEQPSTGMRERTEKAVGVTEIPESQLQDQIVCDESISFLREHQAAQPDKPWFLCASFSRPHFPLTAPARHINRFWPDNTSKPKIPATGDAYNHPMSVGMRKGFRTDEINEEEMMYARACYFACVTYLDEVIGDFFVRLEKDGLLDNTIIVYSTDHGEMAGEHGVWWKNGWYEACTRVPLIISTPEQRRGDVPANVVNTPVSLLDMFPTLTSMADVDYPHNLSGFDLSSCIKDNTSAPDRPVLVDNLTPRWGAGTEFRMVRKQQYKYVRFRNAPSLAFDLEKDPEEQHNLLTSKEPLPEIVKELELFANESIDFNETEKERTQRDGKLHENFQHGIKEKALNVYTMPSGKLYDAEKSLYDPNILSKSSAEAFGEDYAKQNKV
jgi:choline-sulfatase